MNDISTTVMGIYYFGYMPSFWIRLRCLGAVPPAAIFAMFLPPKARALFPICALESVGADLFSSGALIEWWTMISIVAADVAAYFSGTRYGKRALIKVSPNKTWEGLAGGVLAAVAFSTTGAVLMGWPLPAVSGPSYGLICAVMALIGDLTVSLLKRSAGVKDTGALLPGHGGLLDRLDSYLLVLAKSCPLDRAA
jgi:phosphatidate cytidylyltransferase|tara:strand:+ start:112 stop:696 length:585 start_codon:yes stop_codon:yes gene_type:complete